MHRARVSIFFAILTAWVGGTGYLLAGLTGLVVALFGAICLNMSLYWWGEIAVRRLHRAYEIAAEDKPEIVAILQALASHANIPAPRLYAIDIPAANAFAIGRSPQHAALVVTTGLLHLLDRDELASVMAHELAHIKHHDTQITTLLAALTGILSRPVASAMPKWPFRADNPPIGNDGLTMAVGFLASCAVTPLVAWSRLFVTRLREFEADEAGAWLTGEPLAMVKALRKLDYWSQVTPTPMGSPITAYLYTVNPFSLGKWAHGFDPHPSVVDRILSLELINDMYDGTPEADDTHVQHRPRTAAGTQFHL